MSEICSSLSMIANRFKCENNYPMLILACVSFWVSSISNQLDYYSDMHEGIGIIVSELRQLSAVLAGCGVCAGRIMGFKYI